MNENELYTWAKSHGREYVLRRGDGSEAGRVTMEGFCGTAARAAADGRSWRFKRSGLFKPVLTVQRGGENAPLFAGAFTISGNCQISLGDGLRYRWKAVSCLRGEYAWLAEDGTPLIRFQPKSWFRGEQRIDVASSAVPAETAVLLALLGGYLEVLASNDAAASTAALIAVISAS